MKTLKPISWVIIVLAAILVIVLLTGCGSNADTATDNIRKEAEKFKVVRKLVVTNSITDKPIYLVTGRCSFEVEDRRLNIICKQPDGKLILTDVGLGDNTTWTSVQLSGINVSEYRTKIIIRPESLIPDLDLVTGNQDPDATPKNPAPVKP